jgi:hypothetical protein
MVNIKTSNGQFTWNNKQIKKHQIATRLDRFLVLDSIILQGLNLYYSILPWGEFKPLANPIGRKLPNHIEE